MEQVWYAAYGSNLSRERFGHYLFGGRPSGASRTYPGVRDRTPPTSDHPLLLPGRLYFAWESPTWTGGVAFYDPTVREGAPTVAARAYLLTVQQFSDVAAQEMHRPPGDEVDVAGLLAHAPVATLGPGRYETLHQVGELEGLAVVTFSAPWTIETAPLNAPSAAYLRRIADGLREAHGWSAEQTCDYLLDCPGVQPTWSRASLAGATD
ncbi:histone deacetylase [Allobranchiibius sp. GilTou73]|uniref:histone deacetylase n=1 Tax=Allobranchiibius sp. GilTou73 TaxID=2904523 RepID=UPI001F2445BA|nr:histone deacetylase [Allobranchiibius sp. GilTou73]UIJ36056.1 histone deacetylase [Allobranchiibius sp. GilTou73]